ncbi:hypothetical protein F5Y16DRAFT_248042 [Xylariaceae sp. FL0255]|nr:hypothetical protein F5Y16DRAFT_248042 [Xylariaceae sp. FL0255]
MPPSSRLSQPPADGSTPIKSGDDDDSIDPVLDFNDNDDAQDDPEQLSDSPHHGTSAPMQKRRRVTRACDECRRKKIKCDGKQPCTHCQVYSYDCTYDKPSNRRRNPAPQYIEALENKLCRAEALLRKFMPDVDLNDPDLDPAVQQEFRMREQARQKALTQKKDQLSTATQGAQLQSMISGVGQIDLDEGGEYNFRGGSSGTVFFKRMKDHFRTLLGRDYQIPFMPRPPRIFSINSPRSPSDSTWPSSPGPPAHGLPSKERALALCAESLDNATCLLRIVHKPSFYQMLDQLYQKPRDDFGVEDSRNLALAFSAMALGCMYNVPDRAATAASPYKILIDEASHYHASARKLLPDITDCRDLTSLQALLFMILFMQSISDLSTCYSFVGIALRSALRMGLHRHLPNLKLDPVESETRRRVFYICRQMDTYISALLGFPFLLNDDDIDQMLPTTVDDQYITKEGILDPPPETASFFEAFNAHVKLMDLLSKIVKQIYPLKHAGPDSEEDDGVSYASYMINYAKVKEMEEELQQWNKQLPVAWRPDPEGPLEVVRVRNLLRFGYAHVQMVLYRPFVHYVSPRICAGKDISERAYACGAAGISVARNIIHLGREMRKQVPLVGPYWFTLYSEFFAIITLIFFVLENQDKPGTKEMLADAVAGKKTIEQIASKSIVADRVVNSLTILFDQLPDSLKDSKTRSALSKKRPNVKDGPAATQQSRSQACSQPTKTTGKFKAVSPVSARSSAGPSQHIISFDDEPLPRLDYGSFNNMQFSPSLTTPQGSIPGEGPREMRNMNIQRGSIGAAQQVHRLDAMMFPSDDPLAYPNQPRFDFSGPGARLQASNAGEILNQDISSYFLPHSFEGIEGQLLGPLPPYMMQSQVQSGINFPAHVYSDPMLPSQQIQQGSQAQAQHRQVARDYQGQNAGNEFWQGYFA